MILKWFPWKWLIKRAVRAYGMLDPFTVMARLRKFAEPSEVEAPLELIRAWTVFQARGVVNTRAIQHNMDWVWPYWVERQFDPRDASFIPRSFSLSHINLTHRNWTAVCLPDTDLYALVDPAGMVTPLYDGWSLEAWIVENDRRLVPSRCLDPEQRMQHDKQLALTTRTADAGLGLESRAEMVRNGNGEPELVLEWTGKCANPADASLVVALRPYNTEGVQFIDSIRRLPQEHGWTVNGKTEVRFDFPPSHYRSSEYSAGDVFNLLDTSAETNRQTCPVGMATAAAVFPFDGNTNATVTARINLDRAESKSNRRIRILRKRTTWQAMDDTSPGLQIPDGKMSYNYRCAVRTLQSLSSGEICPGSYTYRRFWFRDACVMLNALLALNQYETAERALTVSFPRRQTTRGFFESQQGEWDSNGQVLWIAGRYLQLTGRHLEKEELAILRKGTEWLRRKRRVPSKGKPEGLLPAGFSAEHLGPNNFYYWDNFWGVAGLREAARIFRDAGRNEYAEQLDQEARSFYHCIMQSIESIPQRRSQGAIPAARNRRMDAGAIGSLVADYPLQLFDPAEPRIMNTVEYLMKNCLLDYGFFHDMTHSGINPYLTLHLARVLLRAGDRRYEPLITRISKLASATGQWPEAIHPATGGGCMGDGQHGWAAAEWVLMIRALFVREEEGKLVIGSGLFSDWLDSGQTLAYGPTATRFGDVTVSVDTSQHPLRVHVHGKWRAEEPEITVNLPSESDWHLETTRAALDPE